MTERRDTERRRTFSCSGKLGFYCWLHDVENVTPEELANIFHTKAELVRQYAAKIFDDVEEDAEIGAMWNSETCEMLEERDYYETE